MASEGIVKATVLSGAGTATVEAIKADIKAGRIVLRPRLEPKILRSTDMNLQLNRSTGCSLLDKQPDLDQVGAALIKTH